MFYAEISQGNFDLLNRRSFFQGDGQKFRLRFQIGSSSNEISLNFEEPWFLEKQLALGFELHRSASDYTSSYYEVINTGGSIYTRKRLFELFEGQLTYGYDMIKYQDISTTDSYLYSLLDSHDVSKVSFTLLRDTRDKMINTTRGNRLEITTDFAGGFLGGERNFYRVEARGSQFVPLFKAQEQVLAILLRAKIKACEDEMEACGAREVELDGAPHTITQAELDRVSAFFVVPPLKPANRPAQTDTSAPLLKLSVYLAVGLAPWLFAPMLVMPGEERRIWRASMSPRMRRLWFSVTACWISRDFRMSSSRS